MADGALMPDRAICQRAGSECGSQFQSSPTAWRSAHSAMGSWAELLPDQTLLRCHQKHNRNAFTERHLMRNVPGTVLEAPSAENKRLGRFRLERFSTPGSFTYVTSHLDAYLQQKWSVTNGFPSLGRGHQVVRHKSTIDPDEAARQTACRCSYRTEQPTGSERQQSRGYRSFHKFLRTGRAGSAIVGQRARGSAQWQLVQEDQPATCHLLCYKHADEIFNIRLD